jgi:hypothetical protein
LNRTNETIKKGEGGSVKEKEGQESLDRLRKADLDKRLQVLEDLQADRDFYLQELKAPEAFEKSSKEEHDPDGDKDLRAAKSIPDAQRRELPLGDLTLPSGPEVRPQRKVLRA